MASPQTVIGLASHPPFGILSRETGFLLAAGLTSIKRIRGPINVDAFGVAFSFFTIPAAFGSKIGIQPEYEERIVQFAPLYTDLSGHAFHTTATDVFREGELYLFGELFPTQVDVFVTVGCVVQQYWLVAL